MEVFWKLPHGKLHIRFDGTPTVFQYGPADLDSSGFHCDRPFSGTNRCLHFDGIGARCHQKVNNNEMTTAVTASASSCLEMSL
jgi:hypothetical protein